MWPVAQQSEASGQVIIKDPSDVHIISSPSGPSLALLQSARNSAHETRRENAVFSVQDRSGEKECEATSITLATAATGTLLVHLSLVKPCEPPNFKQGESSRGRSRLPSIYRMMSI